MSAKLQPGMVVRGTPEATSFTGIGIIRSVRETAEDGTTYRVVWADAAESEYRRDRLIRPAAPDVRAGEGLPYARGMQVQEVDMSAELMKVNVFPDKPSIWIDVRLVDQYTEIVVAAAQARQQWLKEDRAKLDWFKPGQIVKGEKALARPATVIEQINESEVKVITSNGIATVPAVELQLHSQSIQDLQAKQAQKAEEAMERFKGEVRDIAMAAGRENGWCEEVSRCLKELGIKPLTRKVRAVLHLTVEVEAVITQGSGMTRLNLEEGDNPGWWARTLKFDDDGEKTLTLQDDEDVDMESVEVRMVSQTVQEIHDESYVEGEN